jgi:hypothetical protein
MKETLTRLQKLTENLDAAKAALDETVKQVLHAQKRADRLTTDDTSVLDTSRRSHTKGRRHSKPTTKQKQSRQRASKRRR